jgi:hypothetical protein
MIGFLRLFKHLFKPQPFKRGYFVHTSNGKNMLCKILNEYETREEATEDLVNLVAKKITEKDLYKEFLKKESW